MSSVKLFVQLNGGLGNQMFQYACARSLAERNGLELVVDDWSGFVRDTQYRRHYELGVLPIQARVTKPWERIPIWIHRWQRRKGKTRHDFLETCWYGQFIFETDFTFLPQLQETRIQRDTWITGYWQSPLYFHGYTETIRAELMPPPVQEARFIDIAKDIRSSESVALGVRLYEESRDPNAHARDGKTKNASQIREALTSLRTKRPKARIFVFCTHRSPVLDELELPADSVFVTHDDGFEGTIECLWLLTQCQHHIFTNSSYYWWGAWLSAAVRGQDGQTVIAADNFYHQHGLCATWQTF